MAGEFTPIPLPAPATTSTLDGYEVTLDGSAMAGAESELSFTVSRDGQQLTDLEPYLGAFGHLVSLRVGDLAYLHTHRIEDAASAEQAGPAVEFGTEFPTAGAYRLSAERAGGSPARILAGVKADFQHDGAVQTAEFTVSIDG